MLLLKEKTLEFQFEIVHVPGRLHVGPDGLSRNPASIDSDSKEQEIGQISHGGGDVQTVELRRLILANLAVVDMEDEEIDVHPNEQILSSLMKNIY